MVEAKKIRLDYAAYTGIGKKRKENEDKFFIDSFAMSHKIREKQMDGLLTGSFHQFGVCDGIGGIDGGEIVSYLTTHYFAELWESTSSKAVFDDISKIVSCVRGCNQMVIDYASKKNMNGMGSTLASVLFMEKRMLCINVGDSRIYHMKNGVLCQLTKDQSKAQNMIELKQMTPEQARKSEEWHVLTHYIGMKTEKLDPQVNAISYQPGDSILICSDGLTDMVSNKMIQEILLKNKKSKFLVKSLVDAAMKAGGEDNITVILIQVM